MIDLIYAYLIWWLAKARTCPLALLWTWLQSGEQIGQLKPNNSPCTYRTKPTTTQMHQEKTEKS